MSEIQDAYQATQGYRPYKAYLPSLVIYFAPYDFKKMLWVRSRSPSLLRLSTLTLLPSSGSTRKASRSTSRR